MHFSGVSETRRVNQYCTSSVPFPGNQMGYLQLVLIILTV